MIARPVLIASFEAISLNQIPETATFRADMVYSSEPRLPISAPRA